MASGFPVRLSAQLAATARIEAEIQDRSLTDQVEHWARLGQVVEAAIAASTVSKLKARSHDPDLDRRLEMPKTAEGRAKALALIKSRDPVRYGLDARGQVSRAAEPPPKKRTR